MADIEEKKSRKKRMVSWCNRHRRWFKEAVLGIVIFMALFYGACVYLSYKAADIFNIVVAERQLFPGSVTVDRLSATPLGEVSFEGLLWKDKDDNLLVSIPAGSFRVRLWDVVMQRIGTTTVTDLTIEQGSYVHLIFDDDMALQNIKDSNEKKDKKKEKGKKNGLVQITGLKGNKKFICKVTIRDGQIEAESPGRHFIINHVNLKSDINTGSISKMDLEADHFEGTIEAEELRIGGSIDFTKDMPVYNMYLSIKDCNPKSLDVGVDIDDKATAYAKITGAGAHPVIDGNLSMEKLDITALNFTDLAGNFHYQDGKLNADHVTAKVFGGSVEASGDFDLDEKSYHADLSGKDLKGSSASHDVMLRCKVDLDLHMSQDRTKGTRNIYGSFYSGPGRYHILPFNKITGSFEQIGKTLYFKDVVISLAMGDVTTDAFSIVDGKVHLEPIYIDDGSEKTRVW
ncbi:MAG: DUF3971 domain-containing protein [Megasphaera sp.]|jgi:hypothetical protein|nr:DUF3971 domain-containing protein [Megasphaera sp.]MCH4218504.1 DUF3971 domain-containing protein [Megasphaera sp.]